jgi:NTP pyrophosphatase (non-canonical NTP hydrolase)
MQGKLKVTFSNAKELTLDDHIHDIQLIWNRLDSERPIYDTWLHTVNHASKLGEQVRRGRFNKLLDELGDTVMWFLTFVGKLQQPTDTRRVRIDEERLLYVPQSLSDIVWSKYPNLCPVCFFYYYESDRKDELWGKKCQCLLHPREVETRNELLSPNERDELNQKKLEKVEALSDYATQAQKRCEQISKVSDLQDMFERIYQVNIDSWSLESITFHLLEEIGEVSDAIVRVYTYARKKKPGYAPSELVPTRIRNLASELADIVSWIFAVCLKLKYLYAAYEEWAQAASKEPLMPEYAPIAPRMNFWEIVWRRYGLRDGKSLWCPACRNVICQCEVDFATSANKQKEMGLLT